MKINGIECEIYSPNKLSHNECYYAFEYSEAFYLNEQKSDDKWEIKERLRLAAPKVSPLHQIPSRG